MKQIAAMERWSASGGTGAVSASFVPSAQVAVFQIKFTLESGSGQNADTFAAAISSALGANFAGTLASQNMNGLTTYIFSNAGGYLLFSGDSLGFTFPNSGNLAWGIELAYAGIF